MSAPNDPNPPPPEFALSPPPAAPASNRAPAKPPVSRAADAAVKGIKGVAARGGREESPEPSEDEARREAPGGFGTLARKILGREPTAPELEELLRVRDALDLRDNDALWLVLMALYYMRGQFEQSIDLRLEKAKDTADALIESAKAEFLQKFPVERTPTAEKITVKTAGPVVLTGLMAGLALLIVGIGSVSWLAYDLGKSAGYENGVLAQQAATPPASKPPAAPIKGR